VEQETRIGLGLGGFYVLGFMPGFQLGLPKETQQVFGVSTSVCQPCFCAFRALFQPWLLSCLCWR